MSKLKPSADTKVQFYNKHKNSFGILPGPVEIGGSCPGCTKVEGGCWYSNNKVNTCYVDILMHLRPNVKLALEHNTKLLKASDTKDKSELLDNMFSEFSEKCKPDSRYFRLHWSGDIYDNSYATALKLAMRKHSDIQFWTYTRSFEFAGTVLEAENLILYLSLDKVNAQEGLLHYAKLASKYRYRNNQRFRIAYMGKSDSEFYDIVKLTLEKLKKSKSSKRDEYMLELEALKLTDCTADVSSESYVEMCSRCRKCIEPKTSHIFFKAR